MHTFLLSRRCVLPRKPRVALISTPFISVPPREYGGTELIVAELAQALPRLGFEVVVYTTGDSALPGIECRSYFPTPIWPPEEGPERTHAAFALRDIARDPRGFDLIHSHTVQAVSLAGLARAPMVHTMHHDAEPSLSQIYAAVPGVTRVAISHSQARREPAGAHAVVHHGLSTERFPSRPDGGYLLFIGRYTRVKAPHLAVRIARRAGLPIVLAGRPHDEPGGEDYFPKELQPLLSLPGVTDRGPVGGEQKAALIAGARALVFPIQWEEPFGLVMIEAMLSGVPVLALDRGSVREVVDEGITGTVCADEEELVAAAKGAGRFDRALVRAHAQRRFSATHMAERYLRLYQSVLRQSAAGLEESGRLGS